MQADTAVRARSGMDKSLVKPVGRFELTPVSHRITRIGLADPAFIFDLVINGKLAGRGDGTRLADSSLDSHEKAVAFQDINVLSGEREFDFHFGRIFRLVCRDTITSGSGSGLHRSAARQEKS